MRKKATGVILIVVCLALCLAGCGSASAAKVPVMSVSEILGIGPIGMVDRYSGVIEAGESVNVNKESDLDIAEISVTEGDAVTKGQVLFSYDTSALSIEVERMQLEVEQLNNNITTKKNQITALEKEQKDAASADKLQYTLQIQQLQLDIKETEYSVTSKQKEIDRAKTKLADTNVLSPTDGHIKAVNSGTNAVDPNTGEPLPLIVIAEEGEFRVKGTVNEQNAMNFAEGTAVVIRSRMDESQLWSGTVTGVDWENPVQSNNDFYYMPTDEMTTSSKYPFYVELKEDEGLMIGQHVYIEPDVGQTESGDGESGFYLPSYYLCDLEAEPWVWAANEKDKLEKRTVVLGNYDIELDSYEVLEGLELTDFIAYPDEECKVGAPVRYPGEEEALAEEFSEEGMIEGEEGFVEGENGMIGGEEGFVDGEAGFTDGMEDFAGDLEGTEPGAEDAGTEESPKKSGGLFGNWFGGKADKEETAETEQSDTAASEETAKEGDTAPAEEKTRGGVTVTTQPEDVDPAIAAVQGAEAVG